MRNYKNKPRDIYPIPLYVNHQQRRLTPYEARALFNRLLLDNMIEGQSEVISRHKKKLANIVFGALKSKDCPADGYDK